MTARFRDIAQPYGPADCRVVMTVALEMLIAIPPTGAHDIAKQGSASFEHSQDRPVD